MQHDMHPADEKRAVHLFQQRLGDDLVIAIADEEEGARRVKLLVEDLVGVATCEDRIELFGVDPVADRAAPVFVCHLPAGGDVRSACGANDHILNH